MVTHKMAAGALAGALLCFAAAPVLAQGSKIGLVDTRRLLVQSTSGKQIIERLDKLADEKAGQMKSRQDEIQALQKRIADGRVSLSDDRIAALQRELDEKVTAARRLREDLQKEMEQAQAAAFGEFEQKVAPIVEQFGEEQGFTLILNVGFFNQAELPSGIVWANSASDVTLDLIRKIDAAIPAAPAQP